jgi:hypothetical protein
LLHFSTPAQNRPASECLQRHMLPSLQQTALHTTWDIPTLPRQ